MLVCHVSAAKMASMTTQPSAAAVDLEGIINFRDFGGWPTVDGSLVRRGLLFRSAHHAAATAADLERLAGLGVELFVDLRRPPERQRDPARRPDGLPSRVLEHAGPSEESLALHLEFLAHPDASVDYVTDRMILGYRGYTKDPHYVALFRDYFEALAEIQGPVLVNCHAGKDRTGVLCALTLHALGVERDAIYEDYLTTNRQNLADLRLGSMMEAFERDHGRAVDPALLRRMMAADTRYLDAAFAEMTERFGDVDAYLETVLGVTPALKSRLRERLVEPT